MASFLRSVYGLDTLDTRFTTPSSVPYKTVIESRDGNGKRDAREKPDSRAQPSKWGTPEFIVYYVIFVVTVPYMFWIAYDVSRRTSKLPQLSLLDDAF
jgi:hypothetical protein